MATIATSNWAYPRKVRDPLLAAAGLLMLLLMAAFGRHLGQPAVTLGPWMTMHLLAIVPAVPVGAVMLLRRKGDRAHRLIGRLWATLMLIAAITSFGVRNLTGHLEPIHILSVITLISIPRAIWDARNGRIARHRRTMTIVYASLVIAGYFTLIPTRLLGHFLFGWRRTAVAAPLRGANCGLQRTRPRGRVRALAGARHAVPRPADHGE